MEKNMEIQKVKIKSNAICYGLPPQPEEEVEQHLTISVSGRVWFTSYIYGNGFGEYQRNRKQQVYIGKEKAKHILSLFCKYIESEPLLIFATDIGDWSMTITETNRRQHQLKGSLCGGIIVDNIDMTELIRKSLLIEDLFVFDGLDHEDVD
jgi:hypothetical protein